jgi:hypothetical protein
MHLEFVPLLRVQRELYDLPRGPERFREYLQTMIDPDTRDLRLPLAAMNPMARDHVPVLLDELLALDVEHTAACAVAEGAVQLTEAPGSFRVALVLADDALGGWTNRTTTDFSHRFEDHALLKRGWITGILWTGDKPSRETVRDEILTCIFRVDHVQRHGSARTLREMLAQEGRVMVAARALGPMLAPEELNYAREVMRPHLDSTDRAVIVACLFGDDAAVALGYKGQGLSANAGLALARHDAQTNAIPA